jgi:hypothetical protein
MGGNYFSHAKAGKYMESRIVPVAIVGVAVAVVLAVFFWPSSEPPVTSGEMAQLHIDVGGALVLGGGSRPARNASLRGWVDAMRIEPAGLVLEGWAGDVQAGTPAATVVVLVDGRLAARGGAGLARVDVAQAWKKESLTPTGYSVSVPLTRPADSKSVVRVFAIDGSGRVNELEYNSSLPLPHR